MSLPTPPTLLDRIRHASRLRHYSPRTEEAYVGWIRRFIVFHGKRHPREMGEPDVTRFLTSLAADRSGERFDPEPGAERHSLPL
jgi:hypothetical protein